MIKQYFVTLAMLTVADALWLTTIAKSFYQKHLGFLFGETITYWPILIFYPLYTAGIIFFVLTPAFEKKSITEAFIRGAVLGLLAYGAYDLTNQATLPKWPVLVTVVDLLWGVVLTSFVSGLAFLIIKKFFV